MNKYVENGEISGWHGRRSGPERRITCAGCALPRQAGTARTYPPDENSMQVFLRPKVLHCGRNMRTRRKSDRPPPRPQTVVALAFPNRARRNAPRSSLEKIFLQLIIHAQKHSISARQNGRPVPRHGKIGKRAPSDCEIRPSAPRLEPCG